MQWRRGRKEMRPRCHYGKRLQAIRTEVHPDLLGKAWLVFVQINTFSDSVLGQEMYTGSMFNLLI